LFAQFEFNRVAELRELCGAAGIVEGRNSIAAAFLDKTECEWLFMVDSDMGFAPDTVDRLIEAADRILPALNPRLSYATEQLISRLGVKVLTNSKVMAVMPNGIRLSDGQLIESQLVVWAAGVKAPDFLKNFGGLETNKLNQIVVQSTLQSTLDSDIFALGDCAACPHLPRHRLGIARPISSQFCVGLPLSSGV
jgi:hypothetical protein